VSSIDWTQAAGEDGRTQWDILILNNEIVPGVARVDAKVKDGRDKQKAKGSKRTRTKQNGSPGVSFRVSVELWPGEADDFRDRILPMLYKANVDGVGVPLLITHPQAAFYEVQAITIGDISTPSPKSGGTLIVSFEADEYMGKPAAIKEPAPTAPADAGNSPLSNPPPTIAEQIQGRAFG
jgi:hypothetical protein